MTKPHSQQIYCPNCHIWITHETSFGRWIRNNELLDSVLGFAVTDQDYFIHQFKRHGDREIQCLMQIEIKQFGKLLSESQQETLHIQNQLLRNRKNKSLNWQSGFRLQKVWSTKHKKNISVRHFGIHVLTFSQLGPDDSKTIRWDQKRDITLDVLTSILRFDLDPDSLRRMDLRLHHKTREHLVMEETDLGFMNEIKLVKRS